MMGAVRRRPLVVVGGVVLLLAFRFAVVATWHAPAGDGVQYHQLAQQLSLTGRFAFGPPPGELSYSRLPGYPLFLSYIAVRTAPLPLEAHVRRAVVWNVLCDAVTALLVLLIVRERRLGGRRAQLGAAVATLVCPLLVLLSCYALTETLATLLGTLELYLVVRTMRTRPLVNAALAGAVAGLAQLVRADAAALLPGVALAIVFTAAPWRRRAEMASVFVLAFAVVFAPWPLRNLRAFGRPYPAGVSWRGFDGRPLPDGHIAWSRTWASSKQGESYLDMALTWQLPLDPNRPGILLPAMYDDAAERARTAALFARYNRERLSPAVDAEFRALAEARTRRHPLRTYLTLPLARVARLFAPVPEWELPMRVPWLGLPQHRGLFAWCDALLFLVAAAGVARLWTRDRRTLAILGACLLARCLVYSFAIPSAVTERYLVEAMPLLLLLAVAASGWWAPAAEHAVDERQPVLAPEQVAANDK
jgi:hypothetical protein